MINTIATKKTETMVQIYKPLLWLFTDHMYIQH